MFKNPKTDPTRRRRMKGERGTKQNRSGSQRRVQEDTDIGVVSVETSVRYRCKGVQPDGR